MKKTVDIILIILIFLFFYFLQSDFFTWFNIAGIMPNLFVILITMIGIFLKKEFGFFFGIVFGLFLDFIIGIRIGIYSISLGLVGLISGILEKNFSKDSKITVIIIIGILTVIFEIIVYLLNIFFLGLTSIGILNFLKTILIEAFYNNFLVIIIYPFFSKFGEKLENDFTNKSFLNFL